MFFYSRIFSDFTKTLVRHLISKIKIMKKHKILINSFLLIVAVIVIASSYPFGESPLSVLIVTVCSGTIGVTVSNLLKRKPTESSEQK